MNLTHPVHRGLLAVAACLLLAASLARGADDQPPARILVQGEGKVEVAPDMAILTLAVAREADTARAALDANSAAMAEVLAALKAEGISDRDVQTAGFAIQPRYTRPPRPGPGEATQEAPRIAGYSVRNRLIVRVRDIGQVGAILDLAVTLGVNEGGNIQFSNADPGEALTRARVLAVESARARAGTLATAAGVRLGRVLEIAEQSFQPRPMAMGRAEAMLASAADAVPIAAGENTYRVSVSMAFEILQ